METIEVSGQDQAGNRVIIPAGMTSIQRDKLHIAHQKRANTGNTIKSAETATLSTMHHLLGTHGLWGDKKAQLPAYIQNIAHSLIKSGHTESEAISIAIGAVKRWASGRGKVTPEVRAAASKALAEWEKLKAEHSKTKSVVPDFFWQSQPDLIKLGGPEGYIHGFICVRPPCGEKPGKISRDDLQVKRDGTILHKPSGYGVGHVDKNAAGKFTATHSDGHTSSHKDKETAVRALMGHYNSGKTKRDFDGADEAKKPVTSVEKPAVQQSGIKPAVSGKKPATEKPSPDTGKELTSIPLWDTTHYGEVPGGISDADKKNAESVYYSSAFGATNKALRNDKVPASKQKAVDGLTKLIGKAKPTEEPTLLHRGVHGANDIFGPVGSMNGKTFQDKGFTSMTSIGGIANMYQGKDAAHITVHAPSGTQMLKAKDLITGDSSSRQALNKSRNAVHEYTMAPNAKFHVDSDELDKNGNRQIHVTVLPHGDNDKVVESVKPSDTSKTTNTTSKFADQLTKTPTAASRKNIVHDASDDDLKAADQAFANRATKLGKDGKVSRAHKSVKDEIARRGGAKSTMAVAKPSEAVTSAKPTNVVDDKKSAAANALADYKKMSDVAASGASPAAVKAVSNYTANDYYSLNGQLRGGNIDSVNSPNVKSIDSAFDSAKPLNRDITVHRGMAQASQLLGPAGKSVGKTFSDKAYVSTSAEPDIAEKNFGEGVDSAIMHITVPKGTKVVKPGSASFVPTESELILNRNSNFRVDRDEVDKKGQRHVYLTQLPKSADHSGATEAKPKKVAGSDVIASSDSAGKPKTATPASSVKSADIKLNDDGSVVSKKTGAEVGAVRYMPGGSFEATHGDGTTTTHKTPAEAVKAIAGTTTPAALARVPKPGELSTATKQHLVSIWSNSFRYSNNSYMHGKEGEDFTHELHRLLSTNTPPKNCGNGCQEAHKFLGMVDKDADVQHGEISRGITLGDADAKRMFQPGQTMDMPVASWTTKPEWAASFADKTGEPGKTKVIIHTSPGAKGLSLSKLSLFNEGEVVTGGRYSVDKVQTADGIMNVYVTQKDFSAH